MIKAIQYALALWALTGGAAWAGSPGVVNSAPVDGWTECSWSPDQRTGPCRAEPQFDVKTTYLDTSTPAPQRGTLFPEMNIRELCATAGAAAAPSCEARNYWVREELVELWQTATEHTKHMCTTERPAPPYARYVVILGCVQAQANVAWEARMRESGQWR